ncbi:MAG: hypothetical protein JXR91_05970 [Deltaproteobacteria bacterium]|nr:hypothetical protein [Deltaproteobacteria bacterium]
MVGNISINKTVFLLTIIGLLGGFSAYGGDNIKDDTAQVKQSEVSLEDLAHGMARIEKRLDEMSLEDSVKLTAEQEKKKAELEGELGKVQADLKALHDAVDNGLDTSLVEKSITQYEQTADDLHQQIDAIVNGKSKTEADEKSLDEQDADVKGEDTAGEGAAETATDQAEEEDDLIGLSLSLGLASAYVFRGYNVFMENSQHDNNGLIAPGIEWAIGDSGVSVGYWGAYQISGNNHASNVAEGIGHEQDFYITWERELSDRTSIGASLFYYMYPFAKEADAGTVNPSWLEPSIGAYFSGPFDLSFDLAYFAGLQEPLREYSYLYLNPGISKTFSPVDLLETTLGLSVGYKIFKDEPSKISDNMFDIAFDWTFSVSISDSFGIDPGVHIAWSNFSGIPEGDEYLVFFTLDTWLEI